MLEAIAMILIVLWVAACVAEITMGGAIHLLLLIAGALLAVEFARRHRAREAMRRALTPAAILGIVIGRPGGRVPTKSQRSPKGSSSSG